MPLVRRKNIGRCRRDASQNYDFRGNGAYENRLWIESIATNIFINFPLLNQREGTTH